MLKRKRQQANVVELGELEARIAQCQRRLADVMAAHAATMNAVTQLETQIKASRVFPSAGVAGQAKQALLAPPKAAKKKWSWRGRVAVPA
ncbi:MAG: hypothetical protein ACLPKB_16565 [Xanthobacteraceae bacterium]